VRSWLERYPLRRRVAFFCTMGGSGAGRVFATMSELAGSEPAATLALLEKDLAGPLEDRLDAFVARLHAPGPHRPARRPTPGRPLHAA
jgi:hypothetical protein